MGKNDTSIQRIKVLEAQIRRKDRLIADLTARLLGSREHELEQRIESLEKAVRKWASTALNGKIEVISRPRLTTRAVQTRRNNRIGKRAR